VSQFTPELDRSSGPSLPINLFSTDKEEPKIPFLKPREPKNPTTTQILFLFLDENNVDPNPPSPEGTYGLSAPKLAPPQFKVEFPSSLNDPRRQGVPNPVVTQFVSYSNFQKRFSPESTQAAPGFCRSISPLGTSRPRALQEATPPSP